MADVLGQISEVRKNRQEAALCIVVSTQGSTPRQTGAKMLVYKDGGIFGTIGGGNIEKKVIANAIEIIKNQKPLTVRYDLLKESMCCGGSMAVYIEPVMLKNKMYIFGAGHTGSALAKLALNFDFDITVIDDREDYLDALDVPGVAKLQGNYQDLLPGLSFDEQTYITIMTYSHAFDRDILAYAINQPFAYLGMIGSQRKVIMTKTAFVQDGICTQAELDKVDMPMGLNIGAEGPDEIAVSIMAKIIAVKHNINSIK